MNRNQKVYNYALIFAISIYALLLIQASLTSPFIPDEFQVAKTLTHFRDGLVPYLDFNPYKNVLAYYFLTPLFSIFTEISETILGMRLFLISFFILCFSCFIMELKKHFHPISILFVSFLYMTLVFSIVNLANLRIDTLSSGLLFLILRFFLRNENLKACLLISIAFLASQKAAFYVFSFYPAFLLSQLILDKKKLKPNSFELIKLSIVMLVPLGFYFLFWFLIGDPHKLYHSGIKSAAEMGFKANYLPMTKKVWADVFYDYSVFTFLLFWATGNSFLEFNKIDKSKKLILYFSSFLIINLCFYKSLWPYNFANFLPVAFILIPWFIENYFSKYKISTKVILTSCSLLFSSTHLGVLKDFFKQRNKEQISEIQLAEAIVGRDHSYLSSFFLLFNNENAFPIAWIDDVFYEKTRSWSTDQVDDYIKLIDSKSPYLLIYDKRLALNLRPEFLDYLKTNFKHFNGSLYTRSYQVNKEQTELQILKAGIYRLIGKTKAKVHINNILVKQGSILELAPDTYKIKTKENIELQWIPDIPENLITNWTGEKKFFPTFVIQ